MLQLILTPLIVVAAVFMPRVTLAQGLVPACGGPENPCQPCHVIELVTNVLNWLGVVLGILVVIFIIIAGLYLVTSTGNVSAKTQARLLLSKVIVGYIIFLSGWMLVDTGLKIFVDDATYGAWNTIQCVAQPTSQAWSRPTASGDSASDLPPAEVDKRVEAIVSSGALQTDIANAAAAAGITDLNKIKTFRALISQESSNCTNKVGPATAYGTAYGCGQLLVSTARSLDPAAASMSEAELAAKLRDDNMYNLTLSARYFNQLLGKYGGNVDYALAAYNGGPSANQASSDCPGLRRWQCVWDSPGCYGTGKTDCDKNEGPNSYEQTRHYVTNIKAIAGGL